MWLTGLVFLRNRWRRLRSSLRSITPCRRQLFALHTTIIGSAIELLTIGHFTSWGVTISRDERTLAFGKRNGIQHRIDCCVVTMQTTHQENNPSQISHEIEPFLFVFSVQRT